MANAKGIRKSYTEWGKVLAHLRISAGESLTEQARRLGFNVMYVSFIQNGRKKLTPAFYKRVLVCYPELKEEQKISLLKGAITDKENGRFEEIFGEKAKDISIRERVFLITGYTEYEKEGAEE